MVSAFSERAEEVRAGLVNPTVDNMLKITNDGRKCALDQRLLNELLPDAEKSKVNTCVENAFQVWDEGKADRTTQLIFCDLSTPKGDGTFNVYDDVRNKLVARGIRKEEIAFIHEYNTETKKADLFAKVRAGQVRILMGSTPKLGAGKERFSFTPTICVAVGGGGGIWGFTKKKRKKGEETEERKDFLRKWAANTKGKGII